MSVETPCAPTPRDLPMPTTQLVQEDCIVWIWDAGKAHVHAKHETATGKWLCGLATQEHMFELSADEARAIGEALMASYLYQFQWQQFVDHYPTGKERK